jgi:hypothetical protein
MNTLRLATLLLAALVLGCAPTAATPTDTPTAAPVATPTPSPTPVPIVYWPLRGTLAPGPDAIAKRPIEFRLGNDTAARPQSGLSRADMVWELLVEGGITRYMLVFHSQDADQIGPVRSARLSDLHYAPMLRAILAHVGASNPVIERIRAAAAAGRFVDLDEVSHESSYTRVKFRSIPQNVYTSTTRIRETAGALAPVTVPSLDFRTGGSAPVTAAEDVASTIVIPYEGSTKVTYRFDGSSGWTRTQGGAQTIDAATGKAVVANNVVIIHTDITTTAIVEDRLGSLSLEIRSTGTGNATVFTNGARVDGTWSREGDEMYHFVDATGARILLEPGQTWVHVVPTGWTVASAH